MAEPTATPARVAESIEAGDLPASLIEVVSAIGLPATLRLIERWGGVRLYFPDPDHIDEAHPIARQIGLTEARALARLYTQERPALPRADRALRAVRNRAIRAQYADESASTLARRYHLTERQIFAIVAEAETPSPQQSLL